MQLKILILQRSFIGQLLCVVRDTRYFPNNDLYAYRNRKEMLKSGLASSKRDDIIKMMMDYEIDSLKDKNDPIKGLTG